MQFTITGYSTALFSTWYFIEELRLLFDAGDGLMSNLLQKSRKIEHVFISHADRDHVTGLLQFNQLNARPGFPVIYYPKDSGSFPALQEFSSKFDPHVAGTIWTPISAENEVRIKEDIFIRAIPNTHTDEKGPGTRSLSYKVIQTKMKLNPELRKLPQEDIRRIIEQKGKARTHTEVQTNLISYSGDMPIEDLTRWENSKILIHEATFLLDDDTITRPNHRHSYLDEVMEMVSGSNIEQLILGHFSSRYSDEEIDERILQLCNRYAINIPVFRVLPGQVATNILRGQPLNGK
ncbi:RNAse Z [Niastella yeongjuensis]|uniref:RNAse Z n=1 Tax=Niastella yeongjuensis TaxID=354355 RepID=A0A1V9EAL9_9BACT|nr:MBL fold metallo-hydrolase [Niastella yeongjuensis]OQP43178.1 RNAse Z [Niastella yeongjuensis]SEO69484.1 ribonuclease Z [Niastella yeongjuensis]